MNTSFFMQHPQVVNEDAFPLRAESPTRWLKFNVNIDDCIDSFPDDDHDILFQKPNYLAISLV
jgi:hypothetical protein